MRRACWLFSADKQIVSWHETRLFLVSTPERGTNPRRGRRV